MFSPAVAAILAFSLLKPVVVAAQSPDIERQAIDALRGKVLTLRTFTKSGHLEFDQSGHPKKQGEAGPWTIYARLLIKKIDLSDSRLRLGGERVVHYYDRNQSKLVGTRSNLEVNIDIDLTKNTSWADVSAAIGNMFVGAEGLSPYVPSYWRPYLEDKKSTTTSCTASKTVRDGGNVQAANLIKQVRPQYPPEAKNFLVQGVVALQAEINESGDIVTLFIEIPAGAGLDESAVEAVSQWKYKPATVDGEHVCVVTTITVNFAFSR